MVFGRKRRASREGLILSFMMRLHGRLHKKHYEFTKLQAGIIFQIAGSPEAKLPPTFS
jgi:hypothetical protein